MLPWQWRSLRTVPMSEKSLIAITMGDPCGVGPEIIVKAFPSADNAGVCTLFVIGDPGALRRAVATCGSPLKIVEIETPEQARQTTAGQIPLLPLSQLAEADLRYGQPTSVTGDVVFGYICAAARF